MNNSQNEISTRNGAAKAAFWRAAPELDVYESASEFLVVLDVPGASAESVNVQVLGSELSVRAEQAPAPNQGDVALASFERRIELPSDVDANSATAVLRDGVLEIRITKSAAARRVKIAVNAN
jgi:HSP20 family molecular chaperone IbpA